MTRFKALGAVCVAAVLAAASPAVARGIGGGGMGGGAMHTGGGAMHMGAGAGMGAMHASPQFAARGTPQFAGRATPQFAARGTPQFTGQNPGYRDHHHHFGPGFGAGLAAGALLGGYYDYGDTYAYDNDYDGYYYSDPSFVCQPGTWFVGADGRRHICQ